MKPIIIGISGASAQVLAERSIYHLLKNNYDVHVIVSRGAFQVWSSETNISLPLEPKLQADFWRHRLSTTNGNLICHRWNDNSASIASGSFKTMGMIIVPCSMGTLGRIASGFSLNLIERCADVQLKERRKLVLAPREMPFSLIHLRNMTHLAECGAVICPPIPAWYTMPKSLDQMIDFMVFRLFDAFDLEIGEPKRWQGPQK